MRVIEFATVAGRRLNLVELTRRNLLTLLNKLDDPNSLRTLIDGEDLVAVRAVEDIEHYSDRPAGAAMHVPEWQRPPSIQLLHDFQDYLQREGFDTPIDAVGLFLDEDA
ncbi:hypothetical protein JRC04_04625 [Mycolicibacterium sp. S2-37]|uniref:hypothetical protein n=1 Tax=Mycolicibacterium sp. S2-37 TaxID=2810297 RepID=UPI001A942499|nr:hypothetical protein [Mycolicibacterium sp. S2-37]MBO0676743.1 hypothetical protein [Mycolicibacterium sp. S2-37]